MIRKTLLLFLCVLFIKNTVAQKTITGRILDNETGSSISSVFIQNLSNKAIHTISDNTGYFQIEANDLDSLYFLILSHEPLVLSVQQLPDNSVIKMQLKLHTLNEVVVAFQDANELLMKGFYNLKKNLIINKEITYLWHGVEETNDTSNIKREGYALFSSLLKTLSPDKSEIPYDIRLIDVYHFGTENFEKLILKNFETLYYPKDYFENKIKNNYMFTMSKGENTLILNCTPKIRKKGSYTSRTFLINMEDSVLISYQAQSIDSLTEKVNYKKMIGLKYKPINSLFLMTFQKGTEGYFMDEYFYSLRVSAIKKGKEEILNATHHTKALPDFQPPINGKNQKLNGITKQLFDMKSTTDEDFWTEYKK